MLHIYCIKFHIIGSSLKHVKQMWENTQEHFDEYNAKMKNKCFIIPVKY